MPNINDVFPTKYLKAPDLKGTEPIVTISTVKMEAVGRSRDMKPVVYFVGKEKGIVLNKTNANKLIELTGSALTEEWAGAKVRLYTAEADFAGETFDVIRFKAAKSNGPMGRMTPTPPAKPAPVPARDAGDDSSDDLDGGMVDDEEIPF